jgi:restriction system protein
MLLLFFIAAIFYIAYKKGTEKTTDTWSVSVAPLHLRQLQSEESHLKARALTAIRQATNKACEQHKAKLVQKRRNLVFRDEYGTENTTRWEKELAYVWDAFLGGQVVSELQTNGDWGNVILTFPDENDIKLEAFRRVNKLIDAELRQVTTKDLDAPPTNPYEYEGYCRRLLEQAGWQSRQTPGSGDQGADVVAEKNGLTAVLQCKLWGTPITNKAVQEIVAAKAFYAARIGIVVSNQPYTPSAQTLASVNNVFLLHHNDLKELDSLIAKASSLESFTSNQEAKSVVVSSDIEFECAACGQTLSIDSAGRGLTVECPTCGHNMTVS